eukprot:TRINITY_DN78256_c0_g1_i1.p1 TRINITY_DN78256_c0_g1~~TRINITY_DN78256_c0_g1_i1.p1  ORF type:complete len:180 (+),score=33.61 TRINITY_DN78256_c0_g1_i1:56-595(+)
MEVNGDFLCGRVKFFLKEKGYGFIVCPDIDIDVFFHFSEMNYEFWDTTVTHFFELKDSAVIFKVLRDAKKMIAKEVRLVAIEGEPLIGEVKSYDSEEGVGSIISSSFTDPVRLYESDVPRDLRSSRLVGAIVKFEIRQGSDGRLAAINTAFSKGDHRQAGRQVRDRGRSRSRSRSPKRR